MTSVRQEQIGHCLMGQILTITPEFIEYTGGAGSVFAANKDLDWHRANTVPVVRATIASAKDDGERYCPPKDAIDGIIYDLSIVYDSETGKYVGSYHCNPVNSEQ